jgi:membrane fusion protein (multidrug efflux system)
MTKRVILTIVGLAMLIGVIAGIKILQIIRMTESGAEFVAPAEVVTTAVVQAQSWESLFTAVGSLEAVQGVMVSAELPGKVVQVVFESGARVKKGGLLVRQNTASERAQLAGAKAQVELAKLNLNRLFKLFKQKIISKSELDAAQANLQQANAAVDNIRAAIAKKIIRAPFTGRLGIRQIGLGQLLREGDGIVSLQAFGPIFVNFFLPQRQISQITTGTRVRVTADARPDTVIEGTITAINPEIDVATRNIQIQATVPNLGELLRPGMYVNVAVVLSGRQDVLTIPATAALYAPYSDSVFVVESNVVAESNVVTESNAGKSLGEPGKTLRQQFVRLGEKRGDYIAVLSGLQEDETVVSSGVFKLRNGQAVTVDNTLSPDFKLDPKPENK